ncbi:uncharacterized protein DNG_08536 [Cephalotrichum gorgonifer]|uniref:Meiotically up-regulated gene 154 protein n=1 Tax=Cephalotrichum gorgonifer TaxID=2041049 RepID=A0AAE8SYG8_9PEZI|nr:uncharacterized protein DNG_08536 [Cephalotrichum gorgonifer]
MAPTRRLVRRRPIKERILSALNPMDFLLWLSEEIETREWDSKAVGTRAGVIMSLGFLLARANTSGASQEVDDVFGEDGGTGWVPYIAHPTVWFLVAASLANAFYTITRVRHYRLFEANIDRAPETPSARRVKVQSDPTSSSPLRFLADIIPSETAESRAHADKANEVWELSVWDPLPACLRLFCLFSPGHVLVYLLFIPVAPMDPRPSVTIFNCLVLQVILSTQLLFMQSRFSQQVKDTSIIHREVLNEYDTKFVHPRLHPVVRDAATQISTGTDSVALDAAIGTPTTVIKREFHTHPNPNYSKHVSSESAYPNVLSPRLFSPSPSAAPTPVPASAGRPQPQQSFRAMQRDLQSPAHRQSLPAGRVSMSPAPAPTPAPVQASPAPFAASPAPAAVGATPTSTSTGTNFGGSMGIYSHARSPLKKATSMGEMNARPPASPRNSREMAALEQRGWNREASPLKNHTEGRRLTGPPLGGTGAGGFGASTARGPGGGARFGRSNITQDRYPSRWGA